MNDNTATIDSDEQRAKDLEVAAQLVLFENEIEFAIFDGYGLFLPTLAESTRRYLRVRPNKRGNPASFTREFGSERLASTFRELRAESRVDARYYLRPVLEHFRSRNKRVTAFDVGGHIGIFSVLAGVIARELNISLPVKCFEPGPTQSIIQANLEINQLTPEAELVRAAVGDLSGPVLYTFSPSRSLGGRMGVAKKKEGAVRSLSRIVRSTTLESYGSRMDKDEFGVVKIDVEGFEPEVFEGMGAHRDRFGVCVVEFRGWQRNKRVGIAQYADFMFDSYYVVDLGEALWPRWSRPIDRADINALCAQIEEKPVKKTDLLLVHRSVPDASDLVRAVAQLTFEKRDGSTV